MQTETKILKKMIESKKELTIRALSKEIKADYKIVHTACLRLFNKRLVNMKTIGNSKQLSLTNKFSGEIFEAELERREEILRDKDLKNILNEIHKNMQTVNFILLLFGSYAKKKANNKSDIDLMFISFKEIENEVEKIFSLLPFKIHYLVFTEEQFKKMKDNKELNVVKEAIKSNVVLYGIEQYYEILKEW
jgi:predicted nucleotidyltransferase